jgi:microsomal dipeptidase-like Zn-dependent dipeptidase
MTLWERIQREIDVANKRALDVLNVDKEEIEKGLEIHKKSIVFDFAPPGGPLIYSEKITLEIDKLQKENRLRQIYARSRGPTDKISRYYPPEKHLRFDSLPGRLKNLAEIEHATDPDAMDAYRKSWELSGVTVMSMNGGGSTLESYDFYKYKMDILSDVIIPVTRIEDVKRAKTEGKHGLIWNTQDPMFFFKGVDLDQDLDKLDMFYRLGLREVQLTYNFGNLLGSGCTERCDFGLTNFGVKVVERLNDLGIMINTSHCGRQTTLDACEVSKEPVVANHTGCKKIYDHSRCKTDEEIHAIAESGGYVGILRGPHFIGWMATLKDLLDHIDHIVELVGVDFVGIGTDNGWAAPIPQSIHNEMESIKRDYIPASSMPPDTPLPIKDNYAGWWSGFN